MKHYISVCAERGINCPVAGKVELEEAMNLLSTEKLAVDDKENSILLFNGYKNTDERYARLERELDRFSTIFLDIDNNQKDPKLLDEFKDVMKNYDYWLYETFSSTPDRPKFRVIIPIDKEMNWDGDAKAAIFHTFSRFADERASWFFSPTLNRLDTVIHHETGREFPASVIEKKVASIRATRQMEHDRAFLRRVKWNMTPHEYNPEGWRNFQTVKECLGHTLPPHGRHDPLFRACSAMSLNGYKEAIPQFLSEVDAPMNHKREMMNQFK